MRPAARSRASDSDAAVGAASRSSSPPAPVDALAAEIPLALEGLGMELIEVKHIHGTIRF